MSDSQITPLGRKIVVAILGTTLVALVLAMLLLFVPTIYTYRDGVEQRSMAQAELLAASLAAAVDFEDAGAAKESLTTLKLIQGVTGAAVYGADGTTLAVYKGAPKRRVVKKSSVAADISALTVACPIPAAEPGSILMLGVAFEAQWTMLKDYLLIGVLILVAVFAFSCRMAGRFRRKLGGPLTRLTQAVSEISSNKDYSKRVEYASDDEVGLLVSEFNAMLGRVEQRDTQLERQRQNLEIMVEERTCQLTLKQSELIEKNTLLLSEIEKRARADMIREEVERINRHDLKSGLSLVIGYPELLLNEGGLDARQVKTIKRIRAAGYRMLDMIRNHLDMFKLEKGIYSLNQSQVDVLEIICELEEEFVPLLENRGIAFDVHLNGEKAVGDENVPIRGELPLLRTMLRNLIQNAIEASDEGCSVLVEIDTHDGLRIAVCNQTSVPKEMRRRFFDKYTTYGKDNGTGLGTYYAALIARTHGATISMSTDDKDGTCVTIQFKSQASGALALAG